MRFDVDLRDDRATVLRRVKRQVLAMLASPVKDARTCAWLRSRRARKCAALLTRLARRGRQDVSGRGTPRHTDARSPRGVEQGAWIGFSASGASDWAIPGRQRRFPR